MTALALPLRLLLLLAGQAGEPASIPVEPVRPVLVGQEIDTALDLDAGRLELLTKEGRSLAVLPVGLAVGVRAGPFGPILIYGIPYGAFSRLEACCALEGAAPAGPYFGRSAAGLPLRAGGREFSAGVSLRAPGWIVIGTTRLFGAAAAPPHSLRGLFAVDEASPEGAAAALTIHADGVQLYASPSLPRGAEPAAFAVALPLECRELSLRVEGDAGAIADLLDAAFLGAAGATVAALDLLREDEPGIDLAAGLPAGGLAAQGLVPLPPEPDPLGGSVAVVDVERGPRRSFLPPPLLLPFRSPSGDIIGVGLGQVPGATRFAVEAGRITLNVPALALGRGRDGQEEAEEEQLRLFVTVVAGRTLEEVAERYRLTLAASGASPALRAASSITVPAWWRRPLLFARQPAGSGPFARYDAFAVERNVREVEERLGLDDFTLVIDGKWNRFLGDPAPARDFAKLRTVIAAQHVKGRRVLLRWNLFALEPAALAAAIGVAGSGVADASSRRFRPYVHEVVRSCLIDELHSLGADGFVFDGLDLVGDPSRLPGPSSPPAGMGLAQIALALAEYRREAESLCGPGEKLLLSPCALPQCVADQGGILFDGSGVDLETREARARFLAALFPDLPIFSAPPEGGAEDALCWAARCVAIGVPAVGSRTLALLDDEQARALGAVLSLACLRPLGAPRMLADGRWWMGCDGRCYAETLPGDAGVAVYPERGAAALALIAGGDAALPFTPTRLEDGGAARVEISGAGALLRNGVTGRVYRFRLD
ncbi:MAG: hypothetical protein HY812_13815 [Planctomycetes bacterium]|nr:hypothetical protein [Planctomycetota bacterium]